eukprot:scaffold8847_cov112-Isochrysis_galbana.AAC.13
MKSPLPGLSRFKLSKLALLIIVRMKTMGPGSATMGAGPARPAQKRLSSQQRRRPLLLHAGRLTC